MMKELTTALVIAAGAQVPMSAQAQDRFDVIESRIFSVSPERVWAAWSNADLLRQWWGPHGFAVPVLHVDFQVGGTTLICMQPEGGPIMCNSWRYSKLDPFHQIEFEMGWVDELGNEIDPTTMGLPDDIPRIVPHSITIVPLDGGGSEMTVHETGYRSQATADISRSGLIEVLEKLEAVLGR